MRDRAAALGTAARIVAMDDPETAAAPAADPGAGFLTRIGRKIRRMLSGG
jgi:hypothetical protein